VGATAPNEEKACFFQCASAGKGRDGGLAVKLTARQQTSGPNSIRLYRRINCAPEGRLVEAVFCLGGAGARIRRQTGKRVRKNKRAFFWRKILREIKKKGEKKLTKNRALASNIG